MNLAIVGSRYNTVIVVFQNTSTHWRPMVCLWVEDMFFFNLTYVKLANALLYGISCYDWPCYNVTRLDRVLHFHSVPSTLSSQEATWLQLLDFRLGTTGTGSISGSSRKGQSSDWLRRSININNRRFRALGQALDAEGDAGLDSRLVWGLAIHGSKTGWKKRFENSLLIRQL